MRCGAGSPLTRAMTRQPYSSPPARCTQPERRLPGLLGSATSSKAFHALGAVSGEVSR